MTLYLQSINNFFLCDSTVTTGGQEIEFQEIETEDQNYCLQNCSGDRKGLKGLG